MTKSAAIRTSQLRGISEVFLAIRRHLAMVSKIHRDTAWLESMSDHELRDIGVTRQGLRDSVRRGRVY